VPIDFAAVAARYGQQLAADVRRAVLAQRQIGRVLDRRREAARAVEQATRMFPVVRFHDGAVTMTLSRSQRGLLALTPPPPSVADRLAAGGMGFLRGVARAIEPFRAGGQERAIGRFATGFDRALSELVASMKRFESATPEPFDPRGRSARDVAGVAALGWRALVDASRKGGDINRLTRQLGGAMDILSGPRGLAAGGMAVAGGAPAAPDRSLVEQLDVAALQLGGGAVFLGAIPQLLERLLSAVWTRARAWLLDLLMSIERSVLDLRASLLRRAATGIVAWADRAVDIVAAVEQIIGANVSFMLRFWRRIGTEFAAGVRSFAVGLGAFLRGFVELMRALPNVLAALTRLDLTSLISGALDLRARGVPVPTLTLGSLLDEDARRVNVDLAERLFVVVLNAKQILDRGRALLGQAGGELWGRSLFDKANRQFARAVWLIQTLFPGWSVGQSGEGPLVVETSPEASPLPFASNFPNLTLFVGGRAQRVIDFVDLLRASLDHRLGELLRRTGDGFGRLAGEFERDARGAGRLGNASRFAQIHDQATGLAGRIVGSEVRAAREGAAPSDPMARAMESWLAGGGFVVIGEVIPAYVAEIARHWREQVHHGEELTTPLLPTSPRILRRRAALGRVALPRMTMRVPAGRELDVTLADEVAERFALTMRDAYATGQRRLAELAALPGT
jgi:hypothetical protein